MALGFALSFHSFNIVAMLLESLAKMAEWTVNLFLSGPIWNV
jgi:hypothetical protein